MKDAIFEAKFSRRRTSSRRNVFPGEPFFMLPLALYSSGLARVMHPSEFIRYATLLRVGNYCSNKQVSIDLASLKELDDVSERAAWLAHRKLQEYGLIRIAKTHPFTYTLIEPPFWEPVGRMRPKFKWLGQSLKVELEWGQENS